MRSRTFFRSIDSHVWTLNRQLEQQALQNVCSHVHLPTRIRSSVWYVHLWFRKSCTKRMVKIYNKQSSRPKLRRFKNCVHHYSSSIHVYSRRASHSIALLKKPNEIYEKNILALNSNINITTYTICQCFVQELVNQHC